MKNLVLFSCLILTTICLSHSGRTDSYGGHNDNIHGGYHKHNHGNFDDESFKSKNKPYKPYKISNWELLIGLLIMTFPLSWGIIYLIFTSIFKLFKRKEK
jgi:hypothetical protein